MKKITVDGIGYYLSCMMLFNFIYSIKIVMDGLFTPCNVNWKSWIHIVDFLTFLISTILFIAGLFFTVAIVKRDDSIQSESTLGRKVEVSELADLTGENYFTNYSLLVLTGLSLPTNKNLFSLILYILVFATLGVVYIKKDLIYMNPAMTVLNFSIYKCMNVLDNKSYVIVVRNARLVDGDIVNYQNTSKKIIRINGSNAIKKKVNQ